MPAVVDINSRHCLSIDKHHTNPPNRSKLVMYYEEKKHHTFTSSDLAATSYWNYLHLNIYIYGIVLKSTNAITNCYRWYQE